MRILTALIRVYQTVQFIMVIVFARQNYRLFYEYVLYGLLNDIIGLPSWAYYALGSTLNALDSALDALGNTLGSMLNALTRSIGDFGSKIANYLRFSPRVFITDISTVIVTNTSKTFHMLTEWIGTTEAVLFTNKNTTGSTTEISALLAEWSSWAATVRWRDLIWFPPVYAFLASLTYFYSMDVGSLYTLVLHGEHSSISFNLLFLTFVTPFMVAICALNCLGYYIFPWEPQDAPEAAQGLLTFSVLATSACEIYYFLARVAQEIGKTYNMFNILRARLRDTQGFSDTQRYTSLSMILYWSARLVFSVVGPVIMLYRPGHPKQVAAANAILSLKGKLRRTIATVFRISSDRPQFREETAKKVEQVRSVRWLP
ncbi:hypothetical protein F4677DRAFT_463170 [Hypoxylon crocopeplum]|nr:hypothetical protein F4677DRAFT_463170 [Hypoxylon crocopeplum]